MKVYFVGLMLQKHAIQCNHVEVPSAYVAIHTINQRKFNRGQWLILHLVQHTDFSMAIHHI